MSLITLALLGMSLGVCVLQTCGVTVSDADQTVILDAHNTFRRSVSPTATDMRKMYWNADLATVAETWVDYCLTGHDDRYERRRSANIGAPVGQNFAQAVSWLAAIQVWYDEVQFFDWDTQDTDTSGEAVGHYTQVAWSESSLVGCAMANCGANNHYICNYAYGNLIDQNIYNDGTSCADCQAKCDDKLCDCNGKICKNGGDLNLNDCSCACANGFTGDSCENCPWEDVHTSCGTDFTEEDCATYSNVPADCPVMCGFCPDTCPGKDINSCQNGGTLNQDCTCLCNPPYTGELCGTVATCPGMDINSCQNGGTLNQDCTCLCTPGYAGELCETAVSCSDPSYCGIDQPEGYPASFCTLYANVPDECPVMCGIC